MWEVGVHARVSDGELPTNRSLLSRPVRSGVTPSVYTPSFRLSRQKKSQSAISITFSVKCRSRTGCRSIMFDGPTGFARLKYAPEGKRGLKVWRLGELGLRSPLATAARRPKRGFNGRSKL